MTPSKPSRIQHVEGGLLGFLGFVYALLAGFFAACLTGAGHGWMAGLPSLAGIIVIPFFGAALGYKGTSVEWWCSWIACVGMVIVDSIIVYLILDEGIAYLIKTANQMPEFFFPWLILWIGWQLGVVFAVIRLMRMRREICQPE